MKGFKKDGKFRPTEKRKKSSLTKEDVKKHQHADDRIGKTLPLTRKKEDVGKCEECGNEIDGEDESLCVYCFDKMNRKLALDTLKENGGWMDEGDLSSSHGVDEVEELMEALYNQGIVERKYESYDKLKEFPIYKLKNEDTKRDKKSLDTKKLKKDIIENLEEYGLTIDDEEDVDVERSERFKMTVAYADGSQFYIFDDEDEAIKFAVDTIKIFIGDDGGEYMEELERETDTIKNGKVDKEEALDYILNTKYDGETLTTAGDMINGVNGTFYTTTDDKVIFETGG